MAHIVCDSLKVHAAAQAVIDHITKKRKEKDEAKIASTMTRKKHFWSKQTLTREEAIEYLNEAEMWFGWQSNYAWKDLAHAKRLLVLSQHGDPVTIDDESARVLWG